jgi:Uncharacterized protein conserved in bacteria (DUF2188)
MPAGDIETFHVDGAWRNRVEAGETYQETYAKKDDAVDAGRDLARAAKVEHIIRNLDGTIGERNSYGNDPRNIPG